MQPIEKLIRQAYTVFSSKQSCSKLIQDGIVTPQIQSVVDALSSCTASNLKLHESVGLLRKPIRAPAAHIDICENKFFTLSIFVLRPGGRIPLHDHPGMMGALKVIHGEILIRSYTEIPSDKIDVINATAETPVILSSDSAPVLLTPSVGNIHEIEYLTGKSEQDYAAFIDILSPPYYSISSEEPDCNYYKVISGSQHQLNSFDSGAKEMVELIKCDSPREFFTLSVPYRGPVLRNILREQHEKYFRSD